jgi:ribosomal protein S18 acetylase RimI-like enzyme
MQPEPQMNDSPAIRRADIGDLRFLAPLFDQYRVAFGGKANLDLSRRFLLDRISNCESVVFLAEVSLQRAPVGFAQLYPSFVSIAALPIWILNDLFVIPSCRRHGVARALLRSIREFAIGTCANKIELITEHTNREAQSLYESEGYALDATFRRYTLKL